MVKKSKNWGSCKIASCLKPEILIVFESDLKKG